MTYGGSVALIVIGAILRFAISYSPSAVNLQLVGVILMIAGAVGLIVSLGTDVRGAGAGPSPRPGPRTRRRSTRSAATPSLRSDPASTPGRPGPRGGSPPRGRLRSGTAPTAWPGAAHVPRVHQPGRGCALAPPAG